eukprot:TRINITY_DN17624_c0_g1_i1.p1 TRINITY_DN17624_c0_g1~~TRINITY_DN17624_c0_g1_i1.p1  ORF type:complete len:407 (+),score=52.00 TRINITY_DN17624_c0_g1_i1:65-1285(+)
MLHRHCCAATGVLLLLFIATVFHLRGQQQAVVPASGETAAIPQSAHLSSAASAVSVATPPVAPQRAVPPETFLGPASTPDDAPLPGLALAEQGDDAVTQRLREVARGSRFVYVVYVSSAMLPLLGNFLCSANAVGLRRRVLFWALDAPSLSWLRRQDAVVVFRPELSHVTRDARRHNSAAFIGLSKSKFRIVEAILQRGFDVLFTDVDIVWTCNPYTFFDRPDEGRNGSRVDSLVTMEILPDEMQSRPRDWDVACKREKREKMDIPNSGVWFVRSNRRTLGMMRGLQRLGQVPKHATHNDQVILWRFMGNESVACVEDCRPSQAQCREKVAFRFLDPVLFQNAYVHAATTAWEERLPLRSPRRSLPVLVHMNGNGKTKIQRLKQYGYWHLDSDGNCLQNNKTTSCQ